MRGVRKVVVFVVFSIISTIASGQAPSADFTASTQQVCLGSPVNFTNLSTPGGSPIAGQSWDFGDGNSSTLLNASHTYQSVGTYTVTLVVTAQNGQADAEVKVGYIVVNDLPNAGFTTSGNGCTVPFDVAFTNTSDPGLSYNWSFGNGQNSSMENPGSITYNTAGTYNVTLTVTNPVTSCSNSFVQSIEVSDYTANFNAPLTGCVGSALSFTDLSTVGTNSWSWDFGDGQTSNQQNPTHSYGAAGTYTVTLVGANTLSGCQESFTQSITIFDTPTPSFTPDITAGCAPLSVNFTNTSGGGTFDWDFGNGTTFSAQNPGTQVYTQDGTYSVTLTMTDANGCVGTVTQSNVITVDAPTVAFTANVTSGCAPLIVEFTESSTSPNPASDPIVSWLWDFGDGTTSTQQVPPPHSYGVGVYSVTLTVTTQNGCQGVLTITDMIEVGSIQNVDFTVMPTVSCAKTNIDFIDQSTFNGTPNSGEVTYDWDFGDGGTSTDQSPSYSYATDTGYFDVTLIVEWRGCSDTLTLDSAVYILAPISLFTPSQTLFCNPASLPVTLNVTDDALHGETADDIEMIWDWGDGTQYVMDDALLDDANKGDTLHSYSAYGSYVVKQVIHNYTTGCSDSTTQTIHVSQTVAGFDVSNDSTCIGTPVDLTSSATSTHPFGTYVYNMGDGGSATGDPTSYTYLTSGTYDIQHIATNSVGCADTAIFQNMYALELPVADIIPSDIIGCAPITVTYDNNSSVAGNGVPLESFDWTFPDQSTQTTTNVNTPVAFQFTSEGTFITTLVVTDVFGCVSIPATVNMDITKPTAAFTMDSVVCDLEQFTAVNSSVGATGYEWFVDGLTSGNSQDLDLSFDEQSSANYNSVQHLVQLIATDANGCMDTLEQSVIVSMPRADFNVSFSGASTNINGDFNCPPVFASYTDESDSYGTISSWDWDFGDGKTSNLQDPDNTYVFAGTYTLSLSITDEFGCSSDTVSVEYLTILGPSGDPDWTDAGTLCGQTFDFFIDNMNNVNAVIWDFGDGNQGTDIGPFEYSYEAFGTFSPTVLLVDSLGCEVLYELPDIEILDTGLDAFFQPSETNASMGSLITFYDQSSASNVSIISWQWSIDGDTTVYFSGENHQYAFGLPGQYLVDLMITDANGCVDSYSTIITIDGDFEVPNVITPNGDNTNDLLALSYPIFTDYNFVIVNRWGDVVGQTSGANDVYLWDGRNVRGELVNEGVYYYKLSGTLITQEVVELQGFVTVTY